MVGLVEMRQKTEDREGVNVPEKPHSLRRERRREADPV